MSKWFAAKTVYRTHLEGHASAPDADALEEIPANPPLSELDGESARSATVVEERVVLFFAQTADEAVERAEQEAETYASREAFNVFGRRIATRVLSYVEAYELYAAPGDGVEIFSRTFLCKSGVEDDRVLDRVAPLDELPTNIRAVFQPNVSQTARRIGVTKTSDSED